MELTFFVVHQNERCIEIIQLHRSNIFNAWACVKTITITGLQKLLCSMACPSPWSLHHRYTGVSWKLKTSKWEAYVGQGKTRTKKMSLGYFVSEEEAANRVDQQRKKTVWPFGAYNTIPCLASHCSNDMLPVTLCGPISTSLPKRHVATAGSRDCQLPYEIEEHCAEFADTDEHCMQLNAGGQVQPALQQSKDTCGQTHICTRNEYVTENTVSSGSTNLFLQVTY